MKRVAFRASSKTRSRSEIIANSPEHEFDIMTSDALFWCWFFGTIDHHTDELLGWHVAKLGDRWAALEPIRQGARHAFHGFGKDIARGLKIRCDWGPQYIADAWINEVKWLGITSV